MTLYTYKLGAFVGAVLLSTTSAFAQAPAATAAPAADQGEAGTDIIVTAQRREERLQDVPIAISAFGAKDLETRQINSTLDLVQYIPNLIGHNNTALGTANTYSLRGLANTESISTFDPPVGTYVDDIYLSRQNSNNFSFFDIDRIEVLRGPQGTLFGRNTTGGAINIVMKKPADHVTGYVDAGVGSFHHGEIRASVDLPVTEKLLTKVSGYYQSTDGYVHDRTTGQLLNGDKEWGLRGAIRALPSDRVTWDLTGSYTYSSYSNLPNFYDPITKSRISFTPLSTSSGLGTGLVSANLANIPLGNTVRTYMISSNLQFEANDNLTVNFITGYLHMRQKYMTDSFAGLSSATVKFNGTDFLSGSRGTATPLVTDGITKQFSQEIKATGKALDGLLTYVTGFYYINEHNATDFANISLPLTGTPVVSGDRTMYNDTEAYAGYFQGDLHPLEGLTLTGGIRYTDEIKHIYFQPNGSPLNHAANTLDFTDANLVALGIPIEQHSKVWTPRFAINYKFTKDIMGYLSVTKGFKSGGWNSRAYYPAGAIAFTKETVWSYEAGLRTEWFDHMLKANLTGFYFMDYDAQLPGGGLNPLTNTITYLTQNVADMENYGIEAEFTLTPMRNLNIFWSTGTQHARFTNLNPTTQTQLANCQAALTNHTATANLCNAGIITPNGSVAAPTRAPRFTSTLGFNYTMDLTEELTLQPSVNWNYVSGTWVSTSGDPAGFQPAHSLFNAGLTLRGQKGWSVGVQCDNCFNAVYKTSFLIYPYLNNPGTWMAKVGYKF